MIFSVLHKVGVNEECSMTCNDVNNECNENGECVCLPGYAYDEEDESCRCIEGTLFFSLCPSFFHTYFLPTSTIQLITVDQDGALAYG